jgi:predicted helicase
LSRQLINEYRAELDRLKAVSGSKRESVLREAFKDLLKRWGKSNDLLFVPEYDRITDKGNRIYLDGALLHGLRVPFGYWEAKDEADDLEKEIAAKFRKGYPRDNIIFEDTVTAVLYQDGHEVARAAMEDVEALLPLLTRFFAHERQEVADFRKAVKQFAVDLPAVLTALREIIQEKRASSRDFAKAQDDFLTHARDAINPAVSEDDVQEMLIQHILTEDIFAKVFENPDFHRQNNVAVALIALEDRLFGYGEKQKLLKQLGPYYAAIQSTAAVIESHSEKQGFLKGLYENFYKVYNPMAADRLGVVYTPGEIVRFMIRSADWLCETHFGKNLIDPGVEILDPATGTGTFIVELMEHFRGNHDKLRHKYKEELHANEVAILPYYVANLNIEATYAAITGQFAEYPNLCFVDTLDNVAALGIYSGHQGDMFGSVSDENMGRIKRQNDRKISVIIGNPPYNANQQNENDNNKNRAYERIDARIKATYIKASTAQKTKLYDMYARFYRWATDRLGQEGLVAFVTNSSFLEARTFDGFRKKVAEDFSEAWVIDLKGNARNSGERRRREGGNVFEDKIKVGVAIAFFVRTKEKTPFRVRYLAVADYAKDDDKRQFVAERRLDVDDFQTIIPRANGDWLGQTDDSEWSRLIPIADSKAKASKAPKDEKAIFKLYSLGVVTARDDWVYGWSDAELDAQLPWFIDRYEKERIRLAPMDKRKRRDAITENDIKLTRALKNDLAANVPYQYDKSRNRASLYRPYVMKQLHYWSRLNEMQYQTHRLFVDEANPTIMVSGAPAAKPAQVLASPIVPSYDTLEKTQCLARYRYTKSGERVDNITDWAVAQFVGAYLPPSPSGVSPSLSPGQAKTGETGPGVGSVSESPASDRADSPHPNPSPEGEGLKITKDAIFAYCYAVLHDPLYREKYALNLKREFPRIPFYPDFARWVAWGEALLTLHIGYEDATPFAVTRVETGEEPTPSPSRKAGRGTAKSKRAAGTHPKPKLKSDAAAGLVVIDEDTQLSGIPAAAWDYRLGNRSAIDWVLDQHKEKTPRDPTIRAKFNTYRFADYKESCIALLAKVVTVSVETVAITEAMRGASRG